MLVGDPEDSRGMEGTVGGGGGGGSGREVVVFTDPEAISDYPNATDLCNRLFLGFGDVGFVLNVSS